MTIRSSQLNIDNAVQFLSNLPINNFYTFQEIDKMFALGANTSYRKLIGFFKIANKEEYEFDHKIYRSMRGISKFLGIDYSRIRHVFAKCNPPHIKIYFKHSHDSKLCIKKYFLLNEIIQLLPYNYRQIYKIVTNHSNYSELSELIKIPDLKGTDLIVFYSLISFIKKMFSGQPQSCFNHILIIILM